MRTPSNLRRHELIGLQARVARSDCPGMLGLSGVVADETMNTITIRTPAGPRMVPKAGKRFEFRLDSDWRAIDGDELAARPQDRTKMR